MKPDIDGKTFDIIDKEMIYWSGYWKALEDVKDRHSYESMFLKHEKKWKELNDRLQNASREAKQ